MTILKPESDPRLTIEGFFRDGHEPPLYGCIADVYHLTDGDIRHEHDQVHAECATPGCPCYCRTCYRPVAALTHQAPARERSERDSEADAEASAARQLVRDWLKDVPSLAAWDDEMALDGLAGDIARALVAARHSDEWKAHLRQVAQNVLDGITHERDSLRAALGAAQEALQQAAIVVEYVARNGMLIEHEGRALHTNAVVVQVRAALAASPTPPPLER